MTQPITRASYLKGITRVCRKDLNGNTVVGVAFFVADGYLLTCAHVVCAAIGSLQTWQQLPTSDMLDQSVVLEFREGENQYERRAKVIFWRFPHHAPRSDNDIAVLQLEEPAPAGFQPLPISFREDYVNQDFEVFGFPSGLDIGGWATGKIVGDAYDTFGRVLIKDTHQTGYAIEPGFSGSPVWSPSLDGAIVGMTVARDSERPETKVGFMLPVLRLKRALEAIELETLMDILEPQAADLVDAFVIAYQAALGDRISSPDFCLSTQSDPTQALRQNLTKLLSVPIQTSGTSSLHLVIAMLIRPALELPEPLRTALTEWLRRRVDNLADLLTTAEQTLAPILTQATTAQAHLLLWVRTSPDYQSKDRYLVSALFVPNPNAYDPIRGKGSLLLKSVDSFYDAEQGNTVGKDQLEAILQACLREVNLRYRQTLGNRELRIELLLPISLLDNAVEQWSDLAQQEMPAHLQSLLDQSVSFPPIGQRYQVLVRIAERLDPYFAHVRPFWETKWAALKVAVASRKVARQVFVSGDGSDFDTTFAQDCCLGTHLTAPADCQKRLLFMVIGATPTALWLRKAPSRTQCKRMFREMLEHPIDEIAYRVREARQVAFAQRGDRHLGHHLALVWDDPHLVPPEAQVSTAFDLS